MKVGILHPGKMGSSLAIAAKRNGAEEIYWIPSGRSDATFDRASELNLIGVKSIYEMCEKCDIIISICMGAGVFPNAIAVANAGFRGIFVDANHVGDKASEMHLEDTLRDAGVRYVEASIYGWPYPHDDNPNAERTLYLSSNTGDGIDELAVLKCLDGEIFTCIITDKSAKEIKRDREIADRSDCAPYVNHGYGIIEFPNIMPNIDDDFIDEYMVRRREIEPTDYWVDEEGFYVNRGGYRFAPSQIESAPRRYLNLLPQGATSNEIAFHRAIEQAISKCINAYKGIFPEIIDCLRWRSDAHIAEYPAGAGMGMHHDNAIGSSGENENPVFNVLSCSLILSDRCTGGNLVFRNTDYKFMPVKGSAIVYPSGFLGAHAVEDVTSGLRISYLEFFGQGTRAGQGTPI